MWSIFSYTHIGFRHWLLSTHSVIKIKKNKTTLPPTTKTNFGIFNFDLESSQSPWPHLISGSFVLLANAFMKLWVNYLFCFVCIPCLSHVPMLLTHSPIPLTHTHTHMSVSYWVICHRGQVTRYTLCTASKAGSHISETQVEINLYTYVYFLTTILLNLRT